MHADLNQLIPAFLAADDDRRRRALAVLTQPESPPSDDGDNAQPGPECLLNQIEVAKMLGVHPTTVRRWLIPCHRFGRVPRYKRDDVMSYLASKAFLQRLKDLKSLRNA